MEKVVREPVAAGLFYPSEPEKLNSQIRGCFLSEYGPGKLPGQKVRKKLLGAIVPHAGYAYSGSAAAWIYKEIVERAAPDTIIILGPSHTGLGMVGSVWLGSAWSTPLGLAKIDRELGQQILNKTDLLDRDPKPHIGEHSIEVQLPFLQFVYKKAMPKVLPIVLSTAPEEGLCKKLGAAIAKAVRESKRKVLILASSDFTHYGVSYGFLPFFGSAAQVKQKLHDLDFGAIKKIESLDIHGFINYVKETGATICGAMPIATAMAALSALRAKKGTLLKYYTSADLMGSWASSVSYAGIIFE